MQRPFEDSEFKSFVMSEGLAVRSAALADTLAAWRQADVDGAAQRALAYLPAGATIRAKIYPMIKPRENSFVFDVGTDPAIFLFIDPKMSTAQLENTLAHELHHIGYGGSCPPAPAAAEVARLPEAARAVVRWIGAFGEGLAMLAAAGGPQIHPHAVSAPEDRARWDLDVARFEEDLKKVEGFFLDILDGRLSEEEAQRDGFAFFGVQGPWYTVGWRMAATIEQAFGRARLIEATCDMRVLPATYNEAARSRSSAPTALWSAAILEAIREPAEMR